MAPNRLIHRDYLHSSACAMQVHQNQDVPLQFKMIGPGVYSAAIDRDRFSGQWLLKVTAQDALEHTHRLDKKIYIRR